MLQKGKKKFHKSMHGLTVKLEHLHQPMNKAVSLSIE